MKRAFSLPEVLVVMFLSGTVLAMIAAPLRASLWMGLVCSGSVEPQR